MEKSTSAYEISRRLEEDSTIVVGKYANGIVRAQVGTEAEGYNGYSPQAQLTQYRDGSYASETVKADFRTLSDSGKDCGFSARALEAEKGYGPTFYRITTERTWSAGDDTLTREAELLLQPDDLVALRDALTRAIRVARAKGHLNQEGA